jgi:hypothetical protein
MRRYGYNTSERLGRRDRPGEEEDAASVYRMVRFEHRANNATAPRRDKPRLHAFATFSSMRSRSSRRRASMGTRSRSSRRRMTPCSTNATCVGRTRGASVPRVSGERFADCISSGIFVTLLKLTVCSSCGILCPTTAAAAAAASALLVAAAQGPWPHNVSLHHLNLNCSCT